MENHYYLILYLVYKNGQQHHQTDYNEDQYRLHTTTIIIKNDTKSEIAMNEDEVRPGILSSIPIFFLL